MVCIMLEYTTWKNCAQTFFVSSIRLEGHGIFSPYNFGIIQCGQELVIIAMIRIRGYFKGEYVMAKWT